MKSFNFQKNHLIKFIAQRIKHSIGYFHILSVVNILIEELIAELMLMGELKIINFGIFQIKQLPSKKFINVVTGKINYTKPTNVLKLRLSRTLVNYIKGHGEKNAIE